MHLSSQGVTRPLRVPDYSRCTKSATAHVAKNLSLFRPLIATFIAGCLSVSFAVAANTPCSGKKGGIDHCQGDTFICRDGSVSASKRSCQADMGGVGILGAGGAEMQPTNSTNCSCRGGAYCTGPHGGHYCITDDGSKSYLRR